MQEQEQRKKKEQEKNRKFLWMMKKQLKCHHLKYQYHLKYQ